MIIVIQDNIVCHILTCISSEGHERSRCVTWSIVLLTTLVSLCLGLYRLLKEYPQSLATILQFLYGLYWQALHCFFSSPTVADWENQDKKTWRWKRLFTTFPPVINAILLLDVCFACGREKANHNTSGDHNSALCTQLCFQ